MSGVSPDLIPATLAPSLDRVAQKFRSTGTPHRRWCQSAL